jgi:hypothetical protein
MSKKPLPQHRLDKLRTAITHVAYEAESLRRATDSFRRHGRRFDLEAGLLHARNLIEFFWMPAAGKDVHKDGVYAAHYIPSADWVRLRSLHPQRPWELFQPISSQLAHISVRRSKRGTVTDFSEALPELSHQLEEIWATFCAELYRSKWANPLRRATRRWRTTK